MRDRRCIGGAPLRARGLALSAVLVVPFHQVSVSGCPGIALRAGELEVVVIPSLGLKIAKLRRARGREWLWHNPEIPYAAPRPGASYVETADSGEEGIERYRSHRFDCVITDARMSGVSGLIVCRAIKDHDPAAHVVLLTGVEHDPEELQAAGVDRVLMKPTRRANILEAVRRDTL